MPPSPPTSSAAHRTQGSKQAPPLTKGQLVRLRTIEAIQNECMSDDIAIEVPEMLAWTDDEVRAFFESGGIQRPAPRLPATSAAGEGASSHGAPSTSSEHKAAAATAAKRPAPAPSGSQETAAPSADRTKKMQQTKRSASYAEKRVGDGNGANQYEALLPKEAPVLIECTSSATNVRMPVERCQEWEATKWGGFVRTA